MGSSPISVLKNLSTQVQQTDQRFVTMAPACARLVSLEMMLHVPSSLPLLDAPATRELWLVWDRRMPMLEMRHSPREVSLPSSTPLSTESSPTGTIWRRSGTTP